MSTPARSVASPLAMRSLASTSTPAYTGTSIRRLIAPPQELVDRERHLHEQEVALALPRPRSDRAAVTVPARNGASPGERPDLVDHLAHRELARARADRRVVAVHEEELVDAVRGGGEQVAPQAEQVAVARVEARDRTAAHRLDLVRDRDARHRRAPEVVVGDEERRRDAAEHTDLVPDRPQVGPGRRLDLADQLEVRRAHEMSSGFDDTL